MHRPIRYRRVLAYRLRTLAVATELDVQPCTHERTFPSVLAAQLLAERCVRATLSAVIVSERLSVCDEAECDMLVQSLEQKTRAVEDQWGVLSSALRRNDHPDFRRALGKAFAMAILNARRIDTKGSLPFCDRAALPYSIAVALDEVVVPCAEAFLETASRLELACSKAS